MPARDLTIVVIRLTTFWFVCAAIFRVVDELVAMTSMLAAGHVSLRQWLQSPNWMAQLVFPVIAIGIAAVIFRLAPRLAEFVCRDVDSEHASSPLLSVSTNEIYSIAVFVLGIIIMLQAVQPVLATVVELMAGQSIAYESRIVAIASAIVYLVVGGALAIGHRGVALFVASLGHSADKPPLQRFSVLTLLVVIALCAVILGVIRVLLP